MGVQMVKFTYSNGREATYNYEWDKLAPKLLMAGIRLFKPEPDVLIPLNSQTIALIENIVEEVEEVEEDKTEEVVKSEEIEAPKETEEPEKELSAQEKQDAAIALMKELSSCEHENYEYYYQVIGSGPKAQKRYFPVCTKCGIRQRYVKAAGLTDEEKENAKIWDK